MYRPLRVEEGVEGVPVPTVGEPVMLEEGVLGRETMDGAMGVASGSLLAAFARACTILYPARQADGRSAGRVCLLNNPSAPSVGLKHCKGYRRDI